MEYFSLHVKIIDTIFAILGFYGVLTCSKKTLFWVGFFIGIFWFYWVSFSFRYYDLSYVIPIIVFGFGLIYGTIFWVISFIGRTFELRAILLFLLPFFAPFGFNWFKPELIFINSYFSTNLYMYGLFLTSLLLFIRLKKQYKFIAIIFLTSLTFFNSQTNIQLPPLNIAISNVNIPQDKKWDIKYRKDVISNNFFIIQKAIKNKKDLIILPESAFPLYLNQDLILISKLKKLSLKITIVTGGLSVQNDKVFNSSYLFKNGSFEIANKVVLVPFGEKIPLPKFIVKFINNIFFNGAEDFSSAKEPYDFKIKNYSFRNAICYEATTDIIYKNNPKYMIAISNNAWFTPSIEPTLQTLLLKLYAKKYNTIIYHSANNGKSGIIYP